MESRNTRSLSLSTPSKHQKRLSTARCMQEQIIDNQLRSRRYIGRYIFLRFMQYRPTVLNTDIIGLMIRFNWFSRRNKSTSRVEPSYHTSPSLRALTQTSPTEGSLARQLTQAWQKGINQSQTFPLPSPPLEREILASCSMTSPSYSASHTAPWMRVTILAISSGVSSSVSLSRRALMNLSGAADLRMLCSRDSPNSCWSSPGPVTPTLSMRLLTCASWVALLLGDSRLRIKSIYIDYISILPPVQKSIDILSLPPLLPLPLPLPRSLIGHNQYIVQSPSKKQLMRVIRNACRISTEIGQQQNNMKRFYKEATVGSNHKRLHPLHQHLLLLDGKTVKTPYRHPLAFPSHPLAFMVTNEFNRQHKYLKTGEMPMLALSRTAVDADIEGHLAEHLRHTIYEYIKTDTLLFEDDRFQKEHQKLAMPLIAFFRNRFSMTIEPSNSIQAPVVDINSEFVTWLEGLNNWQLIGLETMTIWMKSSIAAFAVAESQFDPKDIQTATYLEQMTQMRSSGEVEEKLMDINQIKLMVSCGEMFYRFGKPDSDIPL